MIETERLGANPLFLCFERHLDVLVEEFLASRDAALVAGNRRHRRSFRRRQPLEESYSRHRRAFLHVLSLGSTSPGERATASQSVAQEEVSDEAISISAGRRRDGNASVLLCVPQDLSLRGSPKIGDVRSHLLVAAEEMQGDFVSLDGHVVIVKGNHVIVESGDNGKWKERIVHVLYTETLHRIVQIDGKDTPVIIKVLHIDRPLRGGCSASCTLEGMSLFQIRKYLGLLRCFPEHELVFRELDEVVEMTTKRKLGNCEQSMQLIVRNKIRSAATAIIAQGVSFLPLNANWNTSYQRCCNLQDWISGESLPTQLKRHTVHVQQVLEAYVMLKLHDAAMERLRKAHAAEDAKFRRRVAEFRSKRVNQHDLGMRPEFQCPQTEAIAFLSEVSAKRTPLEKLLCFAKVVDSVNNTVEDNIKRHFEDVTAFQLTTDDLLDQLIYVLIWTDGLDELVSQIQFVRVYHTISVNTNGLGYNLANFEVATNWIISNGATAKETLTQALDKFVVEERVSNPFDATLTDDPYENHYVIVGSDHTSQELLQVLHGGRATFELPVLENVQQFGVSKFTPEVHSWIGQSGRVRVSTGMHHAILSRQRFTRISCGESHMMAVTQFGQLFSWGENSDGQLGMGKLYEARCASPVRVEFPGFQRKTWALFDGRKSLDDAEFLEGHEIVVEIACGARHSLALTAKQEVWSWGRASCGRLGLGPDVRDPQPQPCKIRNLQGKRVESMACGWSHNLAVTESGRVYAWGCGSEGRLGLGTFSDVYEPMLLHSSLLRSFPVAVASAGFAHSCFLMRNGSVWVCGSAEFGQLGLGEELLADNSLPEPPAGAMQQHGLQGLTSHDSFLQTPRRKPYETKTKRKVNTDEERTVSVFWRTPEKGSICLVPQPVKTLQNIKIVGVDCGRHHSAAVAQDGRVWIWGLDEQGHQTQALPYQLRNIIPNAASIVKCGAIDTYICYRQDVLSSYRH